jgi:3-hydroxymyristoyl/3-hydroxydecanoyl-(acyl carrier protein) dehydratase
VTSELRALFDDALVDLPKVLKRDVDKDEARYELRLEADLRWFDGHFPEQPILPGVAQLHIASCLAEETWNIVATGGEMMRVKFRRVMQPGDCVTLTLRRNGEDRLDFQYLLDGEVTASGAIKGIEA